MKIFNWVNRRFNNKAENTKKNDDIGADDEQFTVENNCNHVFERWRGGILTIGTLGYDPLKDENEQLNDYFYEEEGDDDDYEEDTSDCEEEDEVETEDEEQNPLVVAGYSYNAETEMEGNWNDEEHQDELQFGYEYVMMKKKERTTLADLFSADSGKDDEHRVSMKKQAINNNNNNNKMPELLKDKSNRKHALSLANKLTAKRDARPIHKFNQLMRRMLKRKIHPDMGLGVGPINSKSAAPANNKCRTTDDYASLLPTQDAKI